MTLIGSITLFKQLKSYPLLINNQNVLLVHHTLGYSLIDNKCGHFGVALNDAQVKDNQIICAQHGISFSLETGLVINRPYENCSAIKIFRLEKENGSLYSPDL